MLTATHYALANAIGLLSDDPTLLVVVNGWRIELLSNPNRCQLTATVGHPVRFQSREFATLVDILTDAPCIENNDDADCHLIDNNGMIWTMESD